jgi:hypothetical protein
MSDLQIRLPDDFIERVAKLVAERLAERRSVEPDGWLRGAQAIADHIGASRSRVYGLSSMRRIPVHHDGSALVARKSELDAWVRSGGGVCP